MEARKEWRAVAEHHHQHQHHQQHHRSSGDEDFERSKLGQSDERTIYEVQQGREPADVDFCSITMDGSSNNDILHQRLHNVARQREELQQLEIELRAQIIARSEMIEMQKSFDAQLKEHAGLAAKLQEQLHEKEQTIRDLERKLEQKETELHAAKLDNEAAWAKDDLLREQDKELATFRRERDHSEAERAQLIKQIHDLQEHIQDKERQFIDLQEQNRVAQETILFKEDQLREAHAWIAQHQQVEVLQSHELRERTEQCNQLWLDCQRQFAEIERLNLQMQKLQLDLADAKEHSGATANESQTSQVNSKGASQFKQSNGNQVDSNPGNTSSANTGVHVNGNSGDVSSLTSPGSIPNQNDHVPRIPLASSSLLGMPPYIPPGQMTALHPFVMHQQGVPQSGPSHLPQSNVGHYHHMPAHSSFPHWQDPQPVSENPQMPTQNQLPQSQVDQNQTRSDVKYNYEVPVNGQVYHQDYLDAHSYQKIDPEKSSSPGESQGHESIDRSCLVSSQPEQIASQFNDALRLDPLEQTSGKGEQNDLPAHCELERQTLMDERPSLVSSQSGSDNLTRSVNASDMSVANVADTVASESFASAGQTSAVSTAKTSETALLDERSLLACIVRTIPAGGKIRISSTLPNRLAKMLAPLHWHDYKKKYGKLDDFVASHPELFVIEDDFIQLREGAQKMIAATAAAAKVAAAASASSPHSSFLSSVAVTPVAQPQRPKRVSSMDSQLSALSQHMNGAFGVPGRPSNVKILTKPKDAALNGFETRTSQSSAHMAVGNGATLDRSSISGTQSRGSFPGRPFI